MKRKVKKNALLTLLLIFFLSGLTSFDAKANNPWDWDTSNDFTVKYHADKGCFSIRLRVAYHAKNSGTDHHALLQDVIVKAREMKENGNYEKYVQLFEIDMNGGGHDNKDYEDASGEVWLKEKNPRVDLGSLWYEDTKLISGYSEKTGFKIDNVWPKTAFLSTYETIYWYPSSYWAGKKIQFCIEDGRWDINSDYDYEFKKSENGPDYAGPFEMENKMNSLYISENYYAKDGNNHITYSINDYSRNYDRGTLYLMRSTDNGSSWTTVDSLNAEGGRGKGTFQGRYMDYTDGKETKTLFTQQPQFKVIHNVGGTHYPKVAVFSRESEPVYASLLSPIIDCDVTAVDNKISISWELDTLPKSGYADVDDSDIEILITYPDKFDWTRARTKKVKYDVENYEFTLPASELQQGIKTYYVMVRRSCFNRGNQWGDLFERTKPIQFDTNYKEIENLKAESNEKGELLLEWGKKNNGIWISENLEYKLYINGEEKKSPSIDSLTHTVVGLGRCVDLDIRLDLVQKTTGKTTSSIKGPEKFSISANGDSRIENFSASKGYFANKVVVSWEIPLNASSFTKFDVRRRPISAADTDRGTRVTLIDHTKSYYTIEDTYMNTGEYYTYIIEGIFDCNGEESVVTKKIDTGFSQRFGTISGSIAYAGNQAVEGVNVIVEGDEVMKNKGLSLSSQTEDASYIEVPGSVINNSAFTFQAWIKPTVKGSGNGWRKTILDIAPFLSLDWTGNDTKDSQLSIYTNDMKRDTVKITAQTYTHVSLVFERDATDTSLGNIRLYLGDKNGSLLKIDKEGIPCNRIADFSESIRIGAMRRSGDQNIQQFDGYIDEIRFWNIALTEEDINSNYDRFLNGKESGLTGYYRCDEDEKVGQFIFDISANGSTYNKRDGKLGGGTKRTENSNDLPASSLLSNKGRTDKKGNYLINTIPYTYSGNIYTVTPMFGTHDFNPNSRPAFISPASSVMNEVDFTDVSSFDVSGTVYYQGTNFPVEGAYFTIDGTVCTRDGKTIYSDADGKYKIQVPIGEHYISVVKDGHTFAGEGHYPAATPNSSPKHIFDHDLEFLDFYDTTLITVAGRVAGGVIEEDRPLGFANGTANVGQATIVLEPLKKGFNLNKRDSLHNYNTENNYIRSKAWSEIDDDKITITTDAACGEFVVQLPPIPMKVTDIYTKRLNKDDLEISGIPAIDLSYPYISRTDKLEIEITDEETGEVIDTESLTFSYNHAMSVIYRSRPTFKVRDRYSDFPNIFGEKTVDYTDPVTGEVTKVPAYEVTYTNEAKTDSIGEYKFTYPVFNQFKEYYFEIEAYEEYVNYDKPDSVAFTVPLKNAIVTIANDMGSMTEIYLDSKEKEDGVIYRPEQSALSLDSLGRGTYAFMAGFPNVADDNTWGMNIRYTSNGKSYDWSENDKFRGYVFGQLPNGNDFVTAGPDLVHFILRDPPGSNSSTYIEEGSSIVSSIQHTGNANLGFGLGLAIKTGLTEGTKAITTPGIAVIGRRQGAGDNKDREGFLNFDIEATYDGTHTKTNTMKTGRRISTSNSPLFVGANGDVFIGVATNTILGNAQEVGLNKIQKESETGPDLYKIGVSSVITLGDSLKTDFAYSAKQIKTEVIPDMKKTRNSLLTTIDTYEFDRYYKEFEKYYKDTENTPYPYPNRPEKDPVYITKLTENDPRYGSDNDDVELWKTDASENPLVGPSYIMITPKPKAGEEEKSVASSIAYWNSQISLWKQYLAINEEQKYNTINGSDKAEVNYSFDSGTTITESISNLSSQSESNTLAYKLAVNVQGKLGLQLQSVGAVLSIGGNVSLGGSHTWTDGGGESVTIGYTLADSDVGNYYSVDVYYEKFKHEDTIEDKDFSDSEKEETPGDKQAYVGNSPIFRTRAGQTSCPYEGATKTEYFRPGEELSSATVQIHVPDITVDNPYATDIPSGKAASYTLHLYNNSAAHLDYWYNIRVDDESNPNGAIIMMDGAPLTAGRRDIYLKAGEALTKTIQLFQSDESITEYEKIKIILSSNCSGVLGDRESAAVEINASFVPTCSDISLETSERIINCETSDTLTMKVTGYLTTYEGFKAIRLYYKKPSDLAWTLIQQYIPGEVIPGDNNMTIPAGGEITYHWKMGHYSDGEYYLKASSVCDYGEGDISCDSELITVYKDMSPPKNLGTPNPSDGILTSDSEISILFNEEIQSEILNDDNFSITGVLNGYELTNGVGLQFKGNGQAYTEANITTNNNFSIESWFLREVNKGGTLFSYGDAGDYIALGFTSDNLLKINVKNGNNAEVSTLSDFRLTDIDWQYISMAYDRTGQELKVYLNSNNNNNGEIISISNLNAPARGRLYVGSTPVSTDYFVGKVRQVHCWSTMRTLAETADMNDGKSGKETGLIGYWNLEEGSGDIAFDRARGRNLTLQTDWFIEPGGKALSFNGTNNYLTIPSGHFPFSEENDFTIEMWVNAGKQENTLLSLGHGLNDIDTQNKFSVASRKEGGLLLRSSGSEYVLTNQDVFDNQWHHLALSVKRGGSIVAFIDGNQAGELSETAIGRVASGLLYLGAACYTENETEKRVVNEYFAGLIDELRIWDSALSGEQIRLNMNHRLEGTEIGLKAYYPFEKYKQDSGNQWTIYDSLEDKVNNTYSADGTNSFTDNTPAMKDVRPIERVSLDWTASDNKIVLDIQTPVNRVENTTLTIAVKDVRDMRDNKMASTLQWTAYVNLNRLQWETDQLDLEKEYLQPMSFKTTISNMSGINETYRIEGLPVWLSCRETNSTLAPLEQKEITFVVNEALPIGSYETTLTLSGNNNYKENFLVTLNVSGNKPDWAVDPNLYPAAMILCAQFKIDSIPQEDKGDLIAAFIKNECRGIASPQYVKIRNSYYLLMSIYGNGEDDGTEVSFKAWDASTGTIYTKIDVSTEESEETKIIYKPSTTKGNFNAPVVLNALDIREQHLPLHKGWNWVSFNVENDAIFSELTSQLEKAGKQIKSQNGSFTNNSGKGWTNGLKAIDIKSKYRIELAEATEVVIEGGYVNPAHTLYTFDIEPNWNWISYLPNTALPPNVALADLNAKTGDQLWGHTGFAVYMEGTGWIGNIDYMQTGEGYMYFNSDVVTKRFNYPSLENFNNYMRSDVTAPELYWTVDYRKFSTNMTMTAAVSLNDKQILSENVEIGVFTEENECRGRARLVYEPILDNYVLYLMIYGEPGDIMKFKLYDHGKQSEVLVKEEYITFTPDKSEGSPMELYELRLYDTTGIDLLHRGASVYPNPVKDYLYIVLDGLTIDKYSIIDLTGRAILMSETLDSDRIDMRSVSPGVYFLTIYTGDRSKIFKVVKE